MDSSNAQMFPAEIIDSLPVLSSLEIGIYFLPIVLLIFWLIDEKKGLCLGILAMLSIWCGLYFGSYFTIGIWTGLAVGIILLVIWFVLDSRLTKLFAAAGTRSQNICAAAIALAMNGLLPGDRMLPALFLSFCIGYTIMKSRFPFFARKEINGKMPGLVVMAVRCLTGSLGLGIIIIVSRFVLPGEGSLFVDFHYWSTRSPFYEVGQFIRYGLIGLWVSAGAPRVFQQMGLAQNPKGEGSEA